MYIDAKIMNKNTRSVFSTGSKRRSGQKDLNITNGNR